MKTKAVGDVGEEIACGYLKDKGYAILERNAVWCGCEIDVICETVSKVGKKIERTVVFAEVKTRLSERFGTPAEAVTRAKQLRYMKGAKAYSAAKNLEEVNLRFDVLEIFDGGINHIENAFEC